jgi:hypothetical protein
MLMMRSSTFCYSTLPNAGLGNRLFPWARSIVYSHLHGVQRLATLWWNIKIGPVLRRESDWRWYFGQFQRSRSELGFIASGLIRLTQPCLNEPTELTLAPTRTGVVSFANMLGCFAQLNPYHELINKELLHSIIPKWAKHGHGEPIAPIAIHIRRGDFKTVASLEDLKTTGSARTPLDWFIETLRLVRRQAGRDVPAMVMTDGSKEELAQLYAEPNTTAVTTGSAIGDLLALSRAKFLIGSGGSTFSLWGAFLSQCPAVFVPGQDPVWYNFKNQSGWYVGVLDPWKPEVILDWKAIVRERF